MIRAIAPWLLWAAVFAAITISGMHNRDVVTGVTSNPRSLTAVPVTRDRLKAAHLDEDCHGAALTEKGNIR
jgi:hypothetical protein